MYKLGFQSSNLKLTPTVFQGMIFVFKVGILFFFFRDLELMHVTLADVDVFNVSDFII